MEATQHGAYIPMHNGGVQPGGRAREGGDGGSDNLAGGLPPGELEDLEVLLDDDDTHASEELVVESDTNEGIGSDMVGTTYQLEKEENALEERENANCIPHVHYTLEIDL
jgi:hypothetical protein